MNEKTFDLTALQKRALRKAYGGKLLALCFGSGVDSTAMIVALKLAGIRPDVLTFANTGGEKPETLVHLARMNEILAGWGWPQIIECVKKTLPTTGYSDLLGNCVDNQTLPSLAFGLHSCSQKWKISVQDTLLMGAKSGPNARAPHPIWLQSLATGQRITKLIGYDCGPADMRRSKKLKVIEGDPFDYAYPLQILGWVRGDCVRAIAGTLGEQMVPLKSSCFFCPASKLHELYWLAANHPELMEKALHMERVALTGKHSRFDSVEFGASWEELVRTADRFPSTTTTVGLGRSFAWNQWAWSNGVVDSNFRVYRSKRNHFEAMADTLRSADNAQDSRGRPGSARTTALSRIEIKIEYALEA